MLTTPKSTLAPSIASSSSLAVEEKASANLDDLTPHADNGDAAGEIVEGEGEEESDSEAPLQEVEAPTSRKPKDTAFRQNRMRAIYPFLTADRAVLAFMGIATVCFAFGIAIYYASNSVTEMSVRYDQIALAQGCNERHKTGNCLLNITVSVTDNLDPPIYFYYSLENFYQNVRGYADSYSPDQVEGTTATTKQCKELTNSPVDGQWLYPCGLIANSFFTDSFSVYRFPLAGASQTIGTPTEFNVNDAPTDSGQRWMKKGIAFPVDVNTKFVGYSNYSQHGFSRAGRDLNPLPLPNDEDTIIWMNVAALPQFRKLHRIINVGFTAGDTLQVIVNSTYDVASFNGRKSFIFSTASWMGGKNIFLSWAYFAAAIWSGSCALFLVLKRRCWRREEGDLSYYAKKTPTELNRILTQGNHAAAAGFASASP